MKPKVKKNKTLQLNADIEEHDLNIKLNKAKAWVDKGHRVIIVMKFKGREIQRRELGLERFGKVISALVDYGVVINSPLTDETNLLRIVLDSKKPKND